MTDQQAPERIWLEPACAGGERCWSSVRLDDCPEEGCGLSASEYVRADLLEAAEKRFSHEKIRADKNYSRLIKAEAERDQSIRREQALKSSYDEERKALVENIRLRVRMKELEAERDQSLASVGAVIEKAASAALHPLNEQVGEAALCRSRILRLNPDATAALHEMLAEAWEEGRLSSALDRNPYRREESNG